MSKDVPGFVLIDHPKYLIYSRPTHHMKGRSVKRLKTVSEVIDRLGGNIEVADLTSRSSNAVSNWRGFGKFPANTYFVIRDELRRRDYTAPESLWAMQEPNPDMIKRKRSVA